MGDGANVKIVDGESTIYLYTHWDGSDLPKIVSKALSRRQRWDDGPYLARIIFEQMIEDDAKGETGYGISANLGDGADRIVTVNVNKQEVSIHKTDWTFDNFTKIDDTVFLDIWYTT